MKPERGSYQNFAQSDLEQMELNARNGFEPAMSTCMHAQQYAEKMLKEKYLELFDEEPEKTHNLKTLIGKIMPADHDIDPDLILKAGILTNYYMASRYPDFGATDEMSEETAEEAYMWSLEIVGHISGIYRDDTGIVRYRENPEE